MIPGIQTSLIALAILVIALLFITKEVPGGSSILKAVTRICLFPLVLAKRLLWDSPAEAKGNLFALVFLLFLTGSVILLATALTAGGIGLLALCILGFGFLLNLSRRFLEPKPLRTLPRRRKRRKSR